MIFNVHIDVRDLTADEYREMLLEDKRRKEDLELQKIKRMEERYKREKEERRDCKTERKKGGKRKRKR